MNSSRKGMWALVIIVILIIIVLLLILAANGTATIPPTTTQNSTSTSSSTTQTIETKYSCDGGKRIDATYNNQTAATTTGNSVHLTLSDGRDMTLAQTISADGARYANAGESFVFWSKGSGAFVQENGTTTFNNCIAQTR